MLQDNPDLFRLLQEKEELEQQLKKLEEGAIQVIMEKENTIMELQERLNSMENNHSNSQDIAQTLVKLEEHYHQQIQVKEDEIMNLKQCIEELNHKIEFDQGVYEDRIIRIQHETAEQMMDNMNHHLNSAKDTEKELIQQLAISEDKIKYQERNIHGLESVIQELQSKHEQQIEYYEEKNADLERKIQAALKKILKQEKTVEEVYKQQAAIKSERTNDILKVTKVRDEVMRTNIKLEKEVRRLQDQLNHLGKDNENLEKDLKQMKDKLWIEQKLSIEKLQEMEKKYQSQKIQLQTELNRLKDHDFQDIKRPESGSLASSLANSQIKEEQLFSDDGKHQNFGSNLFAEIQHAEFSTLDCFVDFTGRTSEERNEEEHKRDDEKEEHKEPTNAPETPILQPHAALQNAKQESYFISVKKEKISIQDSIQSPPPAKLVNEIDNLREENDALRELILQLKQENEDLLRSTQNHEKTIELLQTEIKNSQRLGGHDQCFEKERQLMDELETFKSHSYKLETHFITSKQQWAEEQNFLKEELKYAENSLLEAKTLLAQTTIEKEYFQQQMRTLQNQIKRQKIKKIEVNNQMPMPQIKETDYNKELEHVELVQKAMKKQQEAKEAKQEENKEKSSKRKSFLSYFQI